MPPSLTQIRTVFEAIIDLEPEQRDDRLDALCAEDGALRREVLRMVAADAGLPDGVDGLMPMLAEVLDEMPATLGRYRVISVLGRGGMGVVYEAEQDVPRRRVALKT